MLQSSKCIPQGQGLAPVLLKRASTVALDWSVRQSTHFSVTDSAGRHLSVSLPQGTVLRGGDVLVAEDGSLVQVLAAAQPVLTITHCQAHGTAFDLVRAAHRLGSWHVPVELTPEHLKIEPDPVLAEQLRAMHLIVHSTSASFEPEGSGATASTGKKLASIPIAVAGTPHEHGPGCKHPH